MGGARRGGWSGGLFVWVVGWFTGELKLRCLVLFPWWIWCKVRSFWGANYAVPEPYCYFLAEFPCGWRHKWIASVARPIEFKVNWGVGAVWLYSEMGLGAEIC